MALDSPGGRPQGAEWTDQALDGRQSKVGFSLQLAQGSPDLRPQEMGERQSKVGFSLQLAQGSPDLRPQEMGERQSKVGFSFKQAQGSSCQRPGGRMDWHKRWVTDRQSGGVLSSRSWAVLAEACYRVKSLVQIASTTSPRHCQNITKAFFPGST